MVKKYVPEQKITDLMFIRIEKLKRLKELKELKELKRLEELKKLEKIKEYMVVLRSPW